MPEETVEENQVEEEGSVDQEKAFLASSEDARIISFFLSNIASAIKQTNAFLGQLVEAEKTFPKEKVDTEPTMKEEGTYTLLKVHSPSGSDYILLGPSNDWKQHWIEYLRKNKTVRVIPIEIKEGPPPCE